jgi:glycosyltransferase involved in cell wall biosynthesis
MRILLLSDGIPPFVMGGMQKHTLNLCKFLVLAGHDVTLAHCVGHLDDLPNSSEVLDAIFGSEKSREDFTEISFKFPAPGKIPGHYVKASKRYSKTIFDEVEPSISSFDFIYAQGFVGDAFYKNRLSVKIGVNFHGLEMFQKQADFKSKLQSKLLKKTVNEHLNLADFAFSLGGKLSGIIEEQGVEKARIIELTNAIDDSWLSKELSIEDEIDILKFLFVGRYERRKGIEELSEGIEQILKMNENVSFEFVGPIPAEKRIKHDKVKYHGKVIDASRLKSIYSENHILICPSYAEGMPTVVLEAMSQGLAVMATDVGATRLLVNEKTGWLLKNSSPESILETMHVAFNERNSIHQKRKAAIDIVLSSFTWDKVIEQTINFLTQLPK